MKTIAQMAETHHTSMRTLRFYEERGLMRPKRVHTNRYYDMADERRMRIIHTAKRFGFSLTEIASIIASYEKASPIPTDEIDLTLILSPEVVKSKLEILEAQKARVTQAIMELESTIAR